MIEPCLNTSDHDYVPVEGKEMLQETPGEPELTNCEILKY